MRGFYKNALPNIALIIISGVVTFWLCELVYRKILFSKSSLLKDYRRPQLYGEDWDENFWKLAYIWGATKPIPADPVLGWVHTIFPKSFFHPEVKNISVKRPVLLYGDSFAQCIDSTKKFQDFLNHDTIFSKSFHFLNYGIGAFGVDQMYTLFSRTYERYKKPLVIFSLMTEDLDRSCLSFREGQKPYYIINSNNELVFYTDKFKETNEQYIKSYPPRIVSYLWRRFLYSDLNFLPDGATEYLSGEHANKKKIKRLNEILIKETISKLRESNTDFLFLIFAHLNDMKTKDNENWRVDFIKQLLDENKVPYIWTKDLIKNKFKPDYEPSVNTYFIENDLHPTSYFNEIISMEIKRKIINDEFEHNSLDNSTIEKPDYYSAILDSTIKFVQSDINLMKSVKEIAIKNKEDIKKSITDMAMWLLWEKEKGVNVHSN